MVVVERLDVEAGTEIGRPLLVGDVLVPDVHAPFVAGHVEQAGLLAVGHRHPVLGAEEARRVEDRILLLALRLHLLGVLGPRGRIGDRPAIVAVALGPGDLGDERRGADEAAVGAVQDEEEPVAVGLGAGADRLPVLLELERDELVDAVEVPAVMRRGLVVPFDLAVVGIDRQRRGGVEIVARSDPAVPWGRLAGAEEQEVELRVIGAAEPGGPPAALPQIARPGGVHLAGHGRVLAAQPTHVALDGGAIPDLVAGLGIVGLDGADDAEFAAGIADDHLALDDQRGRRVRVAVGVVLHFLAPHGLAGVLVQGDELGVQGGEVDLVLVDRGTTIDDVAARQDAVGQPRVVLPLLLASPGVDRVQAGVRRGNVERTVGDDRLAFLAALLLAAEGQGPGGNEPLDGGLADLVERAVALRLVAQPVRENVAGRLVVLQQILVGDRQRRSRCGRQ